MITSKRRLALFVSCLISTSACSPFTPALPPRTEKTDGGLSGEEEEEEEEAEEVLPNLTGAPANFPFSFGMTDNSGGAPQSAPYVDMLFDEGVPGPMSVVALKVSTPFTLDGSAADWSELPVSVIPLQNRGDPIGMSELLWTTEYTLMGGAVPPYDFNITNALVRAAYDDQNIYFVIEWSDATENRGRDGLTFVDGKWVRSAENEDRLYFGFDIGNSFPAFAVAGCSAACHFKERLGDVSAEGKSYRNRMHTNAPGELGDIWSWRATTTDGLAHADDGYWDEISRKSDSATDFVTSNRATVGADTVPLFMSAQGPNANPKVLYAAELGLEPVAVPYDATGLQPGARLPGYVYQRASAGRDDVRASGKWRNGKWTVEFSRPRVTTDPKDIQFPPR